jgi:hypothetical protein
VATTAEVRFSQESLAAQPLEREEGSEAERGSPERFALNYRVRLEATIFLEPGRDGDFGLADGVETFPPVVVVGGIVRSLVIVGVVPVEGYMVNVKTPSRAKRPMRVRPRGTSRVRERAVSSREIGSVGVVMSARCRTERKMAGEGRATHEKGTQEDQQRNRKNRAPGGVRAFPGVGINVLRELVHLNMPAC